MVRKPMDQQILIYHLGQVCSSANTALVLARAGCDQQQIILALESAQEFIKQAIKYLENPKNGFDR